MVLEKYVGAVNNSDAEAMASLFAKECYFSAGGGRRQGVPDRVFTTRQEVRDFFQATFAATKIAAKIHKLNDASMEYDMIVGDEQIVSECISFAWLDDKGLIVELIVRPR